MFLLETCITTKYCIIYFISNHFRLLELVESDLLYSMRLIVIRIQGICLCTRTSVREHAAPLLASLPDRAAAATHRCFGGGNIAIAWFYRMVLFLGTTMQKTTDLCGHLLHSSKNGKFSHAYYLSLPEGTSCYRKRTMKFPPTSAALQAAVWVDPPPPGSNGDGKGGILCHIVCLPACLSTEHNKHWQQLMKNPKIYSNRWILDDLMMLWRCFDDDLMMNCCTSVYVWRHESATFPWTAVSKKSLLQAMHH